MKKAYSKILMVFLIGLFATTLLYQANAEPTQIENVNVVEAYVRPDVISVSERVELKFILKNESIMNVELVGRLIVDGENVSEKEVAIESGKEGDLIFHYSFNKKGLYKVSVLIDEKGEGLHRKIWSNEVFVKEKEIVGIELKIVGGITIYPPFPKPDEDVELAVEIKNIGNKEANDVVVIFYADGSNIEREIVDIGAGELITVMVVWQTIEGEKLIRVVVDPKGEFGDYQYDNTKERWITVR
jgi:CARDB protein